MNKLKKILFIVNPKAGTKAISNFKELIKTNLDTSIFSFEIKFTKAAKHATEISRNSASENYFACIAVGGDGSVNETATGLIKSNTILGIIPKGSGNGLARHLQIPINTKKALKSLNKLAVQNLDAISINNQFCFNVAGCGFDGHIAHLFSKSNTRGFLAYLKLSVLEYFKYKPQEYSLVIDERKYVFNAFSISIANSSQFGNNILIAPNAKTNDGLINITVVKSFNKLNFVTFLYFLLANKFDKAPFVKSFTCKEFSITSNNKITSHNDGEAVDFGQKISGKIMPNSIQILA